MKINFEKQPGGSLVPASDMDAGQRKDYRITIKVRNANLLRAIEAIGETPGQIFSKKVGINYKLLNDLIGCKVSPVKQDGEYRDGVIRLCEHLNKMPCDLFSQEQLEPLETNKAEIEMAYEQCAALPRNLDPQKLLGDKSSILKALEKLTERQAEVIKRRFGIGGPQETLQEIAESFDVTRERVREIEAKALRKLRNPAITKIITGHE